MRDEELKEHIQEVHTSNYRVHGAEKIWREPNRQGHDVARCTVERLMREPGITGAVGGKKVITTLPGGQAARAPDLLDRDFVAAAPNRCGVADFTHVKTWAGVVCVAFGVDTFSRRIVGWPAATVKETVFVLDALKIAVWQRDRDQHLVQPGELIHHSASPGRNIRVSGSPSIWTQPASPPRSDRSTTPTTVSLLAPDPARIG
ncbi:IS3 family transposase [Streptomyces sp. NPDC001100]